MSLIEGLDYTIENGLFVFTRDYLRRRGQCCNSGCRNCPYRTQQKTQQKKLRIVSMVPSWTETLLSCGVQVVGRTRFCIHPEQNPAVPIGGTKDWALAEVADLKPDFIVLDREENPKFMADQAPAPVIATDIQSVSDVARELRRFAQAFEADKAVSKDLCNLAERWDRVLAAAAQKDRVDWDHFPGVIDWLQTPDRTSSLVLYVIWRKPWMSVTRATFIGSVLELLGVQVVHVPTADGSKYPTFEMEKVDKDVVCFFASEPFPFHKKKSELLELNRPAAIVNGENFSWFGVRTLAFLESVFQSL